MTSVVHPSISHPSSFLSSAQINHLSLCSHSLSDLPYVLCSWKRDDYMAISLIQFDDISRGIHTHFMQISLLDQLMTLFQTIENSLEMNPNSVLTEKLQDTIDTHVIGDLTASPLLPFEVSDNFKNSQYRSEFCHSLHMEYAQRKLHLENVGSEITQIDLYWTIWRERLHQILTSVSTVFSIYTDFSQLLISHWQGVSCMMGIDIAEAPDYQSN